MRSCCLGVMDWKMGHLRWNGRRIYVTVMANFIIHQVDEQTNLHI